MDGQTRKLAVAVVTFYTDEFSAEELRTPCALKQELESWVEYLKGHVVSVSAEMVDSEEVTMSDST